MLSSDEEAEVGEKLTKFDRKLTQHIKKDFSEMKKKVDKMSDEGLEEEIYSKVDERLQMLNQEIIDRLNNLEKNSRVEAEKSKALLEEIKTVNLSGEMSKDMMKKSMDQLKIENIEKDADSIKQSLVNIGSGENQDMDFRA